MFLPSRLPVAILLATFAAGLAAGTRAAGTAPGPVGAVPSPSGTVTVGYAPPGNALPRTTGPAQNRRICSRLWPQAAPSALCCGAKSKSSCRPAKMRTVEARPAMAAVPPAT
jgi:hypothetical protein